MKVTQIASILNDTIIPEFLGEHGGVQEDLSNIVDIGKDISAALTADGMLDNYVKTLINRIGREIYWNRPYISAAPNILQSFPNIQLMTHGHSLPDRATPDILTRPRRSQPSCTMTALLSRLTSLSPKDR